MTASAPKPLQLKVARHPGGVVVTVSGSVAMIEAERLRTALESLASEEVPVIVLDLTRMEFICSLGLGAIISGHLRCRHHQGQIRLVNPTPAVRELLETTRLSRLFTVFDSVEDALS
jgi:anti-sigma B factor antagonist